MPKFHTRRFEREIAKALSSKQMQNKAYTVAQEKLNNAQREMTEEFESHPITREIQGGANSPNLSGTLGGYGNLFTFIGFSSGANPVSDIRKYLQQASTVLKQPTIKRKQAFVDMTFRIKVPTLEGVESVSPSPWSGRSWAREVERGISGFGLYMHSDDGLSKSRSGKGLQTENRLRAMAYRPVKYMSSILQKFYSKI